MTGDAVSIASMTGFAREEGEYEGFAWRWEVRSVNNRGLDIRARMPPGMEGFEIAVRDLVGKRFKRGSFNISLNLTRTPGLTGYRLNEALLERVLVLAEGIRARTGGPAPTAEGLLRLRGVLEAEESEGDDEGRAAREVAMSESLSRVLVAVERARAEEGARLETVLCGLVDEIAALAGKARALAATQPDAIRARIANQLRELVAGATPLPEERLAQEIAVMIGKADVREEIDRLDAHVAQARDLIKAGDAVGRRLDFLSQEFNREANTLCSKSQDLELTRTGLALKAAIEQFREQVQNIE
jgi:uncharacterized protein (TIGR00255 family)